MIPLYLTAVLGASPAVLGMIEGIAESLASLLKVVSGRFSDRFFQRKPLAIAGYSLSAISKVLFVVATGWVGIFGARVGDRLGKGIRTAPRDALIVDSANSESRGRAFGLHRAMDTAGAVIGISLAYWLFTRWQGNYLTVFMVAVIPAVVGVLLLFIVSERGKATGDKVKQMAFPWGTLDSRLRYYIGISFLFNLGIHPINFSCLGLDLPYFPAEQVILLYLLMNVSYLLISYSAGRLSDQVGRRIVLAVGYLIYGLVYLGFAVAKSPQAFILLFGVYGLYIGLTDGVEKAFLADTAPSSQKASVYGLHALVVGVALLPASVIAGLSRGTYLGQLLPFGLVAPWDSLSASAIWFRLKDQPH